MNAILDIDKMSRACGALPSSRTSSGSRFTSGHHSCVSRTVPGPKTHHMGKRCLLWRQGRSIVPGSSVALWILQLITILPLDQWAVCMDDATVQVVVNRQEVEGKARFQKGANPPVSKSKAQVVSSSSRIASQVAAKCTHINLQTVRVMEVLGIAEGTGAAKPSRVTK